MDNKKISFSLKISFFLTLTLFILFLLLLGLGNLYYPYNDNSLYEFVQDDGTKDMVNVIFINKLNLAAYITLFILITFSFVALMSVYYFSKKYKDNDLTRFEFSYLNFFIYFYMLFYLGKKINDSSNMLNEIELAEYKNNNKLKIFSNIALIVMVIAFWVFFGLSFNKLFINIDLNANQLIPSFDVVDNNTNSELEIEINQTYLTLYTLVTLPIIAFELFNIFMVLLNFSKMSNYNYSEWFKWYIDYYKKKINEIKLEIEKTKSK